MAAKKFYLTTPIYYVNARPHIGHAYSTIVADVLARRHRLLGDETYFLTGTDEHGQKIERAAAAAGVPPQEYADQVSKTFSDLWARMGITHDQFIRTTGDGHKQGVQKLFADLYARGQIYLSSYTGQYSVGEEMFVEGPPGTIGPDGRPTETVTEENFFFRLGDYQRPLLNLIETDALRITPESSKNEVLSFLRGNVAEAQRADSVIQPAAQENEPPMNMAAPTISRSDLGHPYVPGALRDLSVSRSSFTWGIPVPEPAASETKQRHVIYVWLDALTNYMTALGYGSADDSLWQRYWPADIHLVGKEITRFHCVYWPAFLLAAGLPLPKQVTANGWLLFDDSKMSKSKGNVVRAETVLDGFGKLCPSIGAAEPTAAERDLFGADILRYYLLREIPFGQDGSFSFESLVTRYNADLANGYGNLTSRTLTMIQKYCNGFIPTPRFEDDPETALEPDGFNAGVVGTAAGALQARIEGLAPTDFSTILAEVSAFITVVDGFISAAAPWKLAKDPTRSGRLSTVLYLSAEAIRWVTGILYPYCPFNTARVWEQLGLGDIAEAARDGEFVHMYWGGLKPNTQLGPVAPIFPRADKGLAQIMTDMENPAPSKFSAEQDPTQHVPTDPTHPGAPPRALGEPTGSLPVAGSTAQTTHNGPTPSHTEAQSSGIFAQTPAAPVPALAPVITIDDFIKIELRVAQIVLAERIPKADKLLRLEVDLGELGRRQILSGIAEWYTPDELLSRKIVVITNLAPRKMRGLDSHGMLLAASEEGGKPILATFGEDIPNGTRLK